MISLQLPCAFGLEAIASREVQALGYTDVSTVDGRVLLTADESAIPRLNVFVRTADRVQIVLAKFKARDFGQLIAGADAVEWRRWIPKDGAFPVTGRSVRSQLSSVPDCQRLVKKSIAKALAGSGQAPESAAEYRVHVSLLRDEATLSLDTTGPGLHKRGYRDKPGKAGLRETLAAAMIQLSYWNADRSLIDPFCGTGTILVEAAWIAMNRPPGLTRNFPAEAWPSLSAKSWSDAREEGHDGMNDGSDLQLAGYDVDPRQIAIARQTVQQANVQDQVHLQIRDVADLSAPKPFGCVITNPPYGERLMADEVEELESLYTNFAKQSQALDRWSIYFLSGYSGAEHAFGQKAQRRRKLYNGPVQATYYQYPGPRPPKPELSK